MGRKARHYATEAEGLEPPCACARRISRASNGIMQGRIIADEARKDAASGHLGYRYGQASADVLRLQRPTSFTNSLG